MPASVATDMNRRRFRDLLVGIIQFFSEEAAEPEHAGDSQASLATMPNAGVPAVASSGNEDEENKNEENENKGNEAEDAARRARMQEKDEIARHADAVRLRKFGNKASDAEMAMDPLTEKGEKILANMKKEYGDKKGEEIFYASKNKGKIRGVDSWQDNRWPGAKDSLVIAQDRAPDVGTLYDPRSGLAYARFAFDFSSVRHKDVDGRLHVRVAHISKATVNPYYGWEIPGWQELGLDRDRRYLLLRDPKELERAVSTANNIQIIDKHTPVSSDDERSHLPDLTIGSTGTDAAYRHPYLDNSLVFWAKPAIDDIETGKRRQLSAAYRYKPDFISGVYEGQPYDGIMRNLEFNHICLVREGRAGDDVMVGDSKMTDFWRIPRFTPAMALDKAIDCSMPHRGPWAKDAGTHEGAIKAAQTRKLHITAQSNTGNGKKFRTTANNHAEVEHHLSALHDYVKKNNLPPHNVTIENRATGEVHNATVHSRGINRGYAAKAFDGNKPRLRKFKV